jgi:hypothetical protein
MKGIIENLKNAWWVRSKTFWSGALMIVYSILEYITTGNFRPEIFLTGLGLIGLRHSQEKLKNEE